MARQRQAANTPCMLRRSMGAALVAIMLSPSMSIYLSHVNNGKTDPVANTFPDENYAREVMQQYVLSAPWTAVDTSASSRNCRSNS